MAAQGRCCVPDCNRTRDDGNTILHGFPNPEKEAERFRTWLYAIGGDILGLNNQYIYKYRKVCHHHFETKYHTWGKRLSAIAVPTLELKRPGFTTRALRDITNEVAVLPVPENIMPSTSKDLHVPEMSSALKAPSSSLQLKKPTTFKQTVSSETSAKSLNFLIKKLQKKNEKYTARLKKAMKLSENPTFQNCLKRFTSLAALFTVMQFREISKKKMGRRFTKDEKVMALSIYKQGPKCYRWLSKIFILPSPLTLSRLIAKAEIKAGINKNIFKQLKMRVLKMKGDDKLCILLFDEVKINPHFDYNRKNDKISGFVDNGTSRKKSIADHALVFMIRGVTRNYKQPVSYTFCHGCTPKNELKILIKEVITELQRCGLKVLATVCDQGTSNVSTINSLIQDTRREYLKENKDFRNNIFEVNGEEIVPLFDTPHLLKGIRNNLLTKNLECTIENSPKTAKWDHIMQLHQENPTYKGIRLIKNLTEEHVNPAKIRKMKVKYAAQIFSKTVATNMGYLADKGIISGECKDTADVILFFDDLFDSMNGSYDNSKKRSGKLLLGPVTPKSEHQEIWRKSKITLRTMKFVANNGSKGTVPSISNWLRTIENFEYLKEKLFTEYNVKSIWMRHFNQDPLENFFGCIRSHGVRNNSPTPSGFEVAFASLLINNVANNHSPGSNCEEDFCKTFETMDYLFSKNNKQTQEHNIELDFDDLNCEIIDIEEKKRDPRIMAQLHYVTGYILRQARKNIFKNCSQCKNNLYDIERCNEYLRRREYFENRSCLSYPSIQMVKLFSEMQDIATNLIDKRSHSADLKSYIKTVIYSVIDFNSVINCNKHKRKLIDFIPEISCRFFIFNWCRDTNKILNGTIRTGIHKNESVQLLAEEYYKKHNKKS